MNAVVQLPSTVAAAPTHAVVPEDAPALSNAAHSLRLALLGTGNVGAAFVQRYQRLRERVALPPLALVANSRVTLECNADTVSDAVDSARAAPPSAKRKGAPAPGGEVDTALRAGDIVVDATASDAIASRHAHWLARGIHVVTANKLGAGADCERARAIAHAVVEGRAHYGDAATVGAGLPLLRSIRELRAGGDRIHAVAGVLSGSLAWLFDRYDGRRPFSDFVRQARDAGYTEPDPREDLSGGDVRRKLLILARAAGIALEAHDVTVASLLTPVLAAAAPGDVDEKLSDLDASLRARYAEASSSGARLRFIARLRCGDDGRIRATVGPEPLAADDPLAAGAGTDNRIAIWSDRYRGQPLLIQGPGAGADVTAAALVDDVLRVAAGC